MQCCSCRDEGKSKDIEVYAYGKLNLTERQVRIAIDHIKATGKAHYEGPRRGGIWIINED